MYKRQFLCGAVGQCIINRVIDKKRKGGGPVPVFSFTFFGFFAAVFALYWLAPHRWRTALLFAASAGFYVLFGLPYTLLLLACMAGCWAGRCV